MTRRAVPALFLFLFLLGGLLAPGTALAAPPRVADNDGAVLYLALAPELAYNDTTTYRGLSATPSPEEAMVDSEPFPEAQIAFILVAYPPEATPETNVVSFGIRYGPGIRIVRYGITPNALQMATRDWPLSGEGMMLGTLEDPDTSRVAEIGWLAIVAEKPGLVELVPHPDPRMGARVVSANPPDQWPLAGLGSIGFGEPGRTPVPARPGPVMGAACVQDTLCISLSRQEVAHYQELWKGTRDLLFLGEGVPCRPGTPCLPEAARGACCLPDGGCRVLTRRECVLEEGIYVGDEAACDPDPCGEERPDGEGGEGR